MAKHSIRRGFVFLRFFQSRGKTGLKILWCHHQSLLAEWDAVSEEEQRRVPGELLPLDKIEAIFAVNVKSFL